jgi:hypothetical protein
MTELGILRPVFDAEVLVIDDLGAVRPSEWVWDTVALLLNTRYNDNRTTIITTNFEDEPGQDPYTDDNSETARAKRAASRLTLGDRITERMRSRLHEMCRVVRMDGKDFRENLRSASLRHSTNLSEAEIAVACADCPKCGKENVYKRVGTIRTMTRSALRVAITCKNCRDVFYVAKEQLQIRKKLKRELASEGSIEALELLE